jgi:fatty-acid desaturase
VLFFIHMFTFCKHNDFTAYTQIIYGVCVCVCVMNQKFFLCSSNSHTAGYME